ncbi:MAG: universal stress protein [Phaeodactylibacter sp.]|nr:universal stress protein [Phaeodactylibacter sp.]MCB9302509.1 universal stress protein [Lewinellaceae bacterium]HQU57560.1 universal stress protein [Saprospiraceae bacterium]
MKKILFPTDFSSNAENALAYAIDFANKCTGKITLLHTFRLHSSAAMFLSVESIMEQDAIKQMASLIQRMEPKLREGAKIDSKIVRGDAVPVITDMADKSGFDLIIMGTQGATGLKEVFFGSTANGVLKNSETPVLAIPNGFAFRPIRKIVFAVDEAGITHPGVTSMLVQMAKMCGAKIFVFHQGLGKNDDGIDPSVDIYLDGAKYSFHYELDDASINESINSFVADYEADMLCMVRRQRGFLEEAFHVSATTREVFNSPVPLLVLHDEG